MARDAAWLVRPAPPPQLLTIFELAGRHQPRAARHGGGGSVPGVDVRLDRGDPAGVQPPDQGPRGLAGVPVPLPGQPDHPGDLGDPFPGPLGDRRLDESDRLPVRSAPDDPVPPLLAAVSRAAGYLPGVPRAQLPSGRRAATGEPVQLLAAQDARHLLGVADRERRQDDRR
jgi:hypothetical protein